MGQQALRRRSALQSINAAYSLEDEVSGEGQGALGEVADLLVVGSGQAVRDGLGGVEDQGEFPGDLRAFGMFFMKGMTERIGAVELIEDESAASGAHGLALAEVAIEGELKVIGLLQRGRTTTCESEVGIHGSSDRV